MAVGSIATIDGSGQAIPGTTAAVLDVGTVTDPDGILTEVSAGRYQPDEAGYYVIKARGLFQLTHNNRLQIFWEIRKNGTVILGSRQSGYGRNSSNDEFTPEAYAIEFFNGTSDYFEIFDERDTGAGTPTGTYQDTHVSVENYGEDCEYIRVSFGTQSRHGVCHLHAGHARLSFFGCCYHRLFGVGHFGQRDTSQGDGSPIPDSRRVR